MARSHRPMAAMSCARGVSDAFATGPFFFLPRMVGGRAWLWARSPFLTDLGRSDFFLDAARGLHDFTTLGTFVRSGDETRAALKCRVLPRPRKGNDEAASRSDQKIDVHHAPEQPPQRAGQLQMLQIDDRGAPADRGQVPLMLVAKRSWRRCSANASGDKAADVPAHLLRSGGESGDDSILRPA